MDDPRDEAGIDDAVGGQTSEDGQARSDALELEVSTTLVEVTPGVAVVFGEVPDALELISLDMVPSFDRAQLSTVLGSFGNAGTIVGNAAEAMSSSAQGLFRVDKATWSLLESGGQMAAKDGAKLGGIFKNGELVAQARFIPVSMTAASAIAAIGPAVAMIALQMQLGEISSLVRSNIQLTTQTLKAIRNEQWAELEGLVESVNQAVKETRKRGAVIGPIWDPIASSASSIRKQLDLYRKNVADHIQELGKLDGHARRQYLESNAEAIVFDTYALLSSLKTHAEYQALRASLVRTQSSNAEKDEQLIKSITENTSVEIEESLSEIRSLTGSLVRELRIIAELPGRANVPLTKKRKDAKASQLTCKRLLDAIDPLAKMLQPAVKEPAVPATVCAPEGLKLDPYLRILQWFLEDGETLRSVAFPYEKGPHDFAGVVPRILAKRVDATWDKLMSERIKGFREKVASVTFVAVTDRRIITANPGNLLNRGELGPIYSLHEVEYVRGRSDGEAGVRATIEVFTKKSRLHWMFPDSAKHEDIDNLAATLSERTPHAVSALTVNEGLATADSAIDA